MSQASKPVTTRPLRILMIAPTSFFSDYGGHIRILEETRVLQSMGHQVLIVTYHKGSDLPGLDISRTRPLPWRPDYEVGSSRHKLAFDTYLTALSFVECIRFRPHLLHGHMHEGALIGGLLCRLFRIPLVFDFQGSLTGEMVDHGFLNPHGSIYQWAWRLEQLINNRLPSAILTSSAQAAGLLKEKFGTPLDKIQALPDCADTVRFDPARFTAEHKANLRQKLGIPDDRLIVAYLGLLADYQGTHHLIEAAARLKSQGHNAHFLVMGYPSVPKYQALAQAMGVEELVTFTGKIPYREAPDYLALGDLAVAPKTSLTEGSGKLLNYMAMAQPVVAYDTPVQREYLGDLGVYAPTGDATAFADAVAGLIGDPEARRRLGTRLRQRAAKEYSWNRAGTQIDSVYQRLTSQT